MLGHRLCKNGTAYTRSSTPMTILLLDGRCWIPFRVQSLYLAYPGALSVAVRFLDCAHAEGSGIRGAKGALHVEAERSYLAVDRLAWSMFETCTNYEEDE